MHPDMLLLAERLVEAMERMSQDVKNISAYVYDLSYNVSHFLNEKRGSEGVSARPHNADDCPSSDTTAAEQRPSGESEHSWQFERDDGNSVSLQEHEELPGDVASMSVDYKESFDDVSAFTEGIKSEEQTESEENYESSDMFFPSGSGKNNIKGSSKAINRLPHAQHSAVSCSSPIAFSSAQSVLVNTTGMDTQEHFSKNCWSEGRVLLLQNHQSPDSFAGASCSTPDVTLGSAGKYLSEGHGEEQVARVEPRYHGNVSESGRSANWDVTCHEKGTQGYASLRSSSEESERGCSSMTVECSTCKKTFSSKTLLVAHMQVHTSEKSFKHTKCGKASKSQYNLHKQTLTDGNEKPFNCNLCSKTFKTKENFRMHQRIHTGERRYKCSLCGKSFRQSGHLSKHWLIHTGEKPFRCNVCGKEFRQSGDLAVHKRTHTGERPFSCSLCGKLFVSSSNLSAHRRGGHCAAAAACS